MKDEIIKHWFGKHVREIEWKAPAPIGQGDIEFLRWGQPETCIMRIDYLRLAHRLYVAGDLGEAIYQWSEIKSLEWIAGLGLDYFKNKCQASETGRDYYEWSEEKAKKRLLSYFENWDDPAMQEAKARGLGAFGALYSEQEWIQWMQQSGYEGLGGEYYELGGIGRTVNLRCQAHLIGLKMAYDMPMEYIGD